MARSSPARVTRRGRIARIELRLVHGRIDEAVAQSLCEIAEDLRLEEEIAVVVLGSHGRDFGLGFGGQPWGAALDCVAAVARLPQPVIAAIQGRAAAEGCELALACDLRVAASTSSLSVPQIVAGQLPSHGATQRLPRLIGATRALDLLWSGREVGGAEAASIGLVSRAVPASRLEATVDALATELAAKGPQALRLAKEAVLASADLTLNQGIRLEQDLYVLLQTTEERAEGIAAFLEKRKPKFR